MCGTFKLFFLGVCFYENLIEKINFHEFWKKIDNNPNIRNTLLYLVEGFEPRNLSNIKYFKQ